jgi:Universal stress protein UspA and related nucleotide-binding proteins
MFEKILYPTDFSDVAGKAMCFIKQLKGAGTKEVIVLHVTDVRNINAWDWQTATESFVEIKKDMEKEIAKKMNSIEAELSKAGLKVKTRVEEGVPLKEILRVEDEEDISVTVLGSHGRSNIAEMLLGSVSEKVIRKARKPVLVIKR